MSDGLIVPKQVEYVIVKPGRRRLPISVILSAVILAAAVGGVFLVRHYRQPHKYPVLQFPEIGLKATLRTKWVSGSGQYIFQVRPLPGNEDRFDRVVQTIPQDQIHFEIYLLDADGFELCTAVPVMHALRANTAKVSAMKADSAFSNCTQEQMQAASKWRVYYRFPLLGAQIPNPPGGIPQR